MEGAATPVLLLGVLAVAAEVGRCGAREAARTFPRAQGCARSVGSGLRFIALVLWWWSIALGFAAFQRWYFGSVSTCNMPFSYAGSLFLWEGIIAVVVTACRGLTPCAVFAKLGARRYWRMGAPAGALVALEVALSALAFEYIDISLHTVVKGCTVVVVLLISLLMGIEKLDLFIAACVTTTVVGVAVAASSERATLKWQGLALTLVASICNATRWVLSQLLVKPRPAAARRARSSALVRARRIAQRARNLAQRVLQSDAGNGEAGSDAPLSPAPSLLRRAQRAASAQRERARDGADDAKSSGRDDDSNEAVVLDIAWDDDDATPVCDGDVLPSPRGSPEAEGIAELRRWRRRHAKITESDAGPAASARAPCAAGSGGGSASAAPNDSAALVLDHIGALPNDGGDEDSAPPLRPPASLGAVEAVLVGAPTAVLTLLPAILFWELPKLFRSRRSDELAVCAATLVPAIGAGSIFGVVLVIAEYTLLRLSGSLSVTMLAMLKDILLLILAAVSFGESFPLLKAAGVACSLAGVGAYHTREVWRHVRARALL